MTGIFRNVVSMRRRLKYIQPKDRFGRTNSNSSMISVPRHQLILHNAANDVPGRDVDLLDEGGVVAWNVDDKVAELVHHLDVVAGQSNDGQAALPGGLAGSNDIGRAAGGRESHKGVAGLAERLHLAGAELLKAEIVADGRQSGSVGGQRDRGKRRTIDPEAHHQLGRQMLRVGRAAAIAGKQDLAARPQRVVDDLDRAPTMIFDLRNVY